MNIDHSKYSDEYLARILKTVSTIALVGASAKPQRPGHYVMAYLQSCGYRVIPVNPRLAGEVLLGETVYASLEDIPISVDMVDIFRRSEEVADLCEEALAIGVHVIWMQIGVHDSDAARRAEQQGVQVVMGRCPKVEIPRLRNMGLL